MFCVKTSIDSVVTGVHQFDTEDQRRSWLFDFGFVEGRDVWYHPFSGEIAGTFENPENMPVESLKLYHTCDKRFTPRTRGVYLG